MWSQIARYATLGVIGLGASALTLTILFVPDLGVGMLAGLVVARVVMGAARWVAVLLYGRGLLSAKRPTLAFAG